MDGHTTVDKQAKSAFTPTLAQAIWMSLALLGGAIVGLVVWLFLFLCFGYPTQTEMTVIGAFQIPAEIRFGAMNYEQWLLERVGVIVFPLLCAVYFAKTTWHSITKRHNSVSQSD